MQRNLLKIFLYKKTKQTNTYKTNQPNKTPQTENSEKYTAK